MLRINVEKSDSIERALKQFKHKTQRTSLLKEIRDRQSFTKKSVKRRKEVLNAKYKQKKNNDN